MVSHVAELLGFWNRFDACCRSDGRVRQGSIPKREWELLLRATVAVVGTNDALDQVMTDDVDIFEVAEADAFDSV